MVNVKVYFHKNPVEITSVFYIIHRKNPQKTAASACSGFYLTDSLQNDLPEALLASL